MNTGDLWPSLEEAEPRVLRMQAKLHQWATDSPDRRFCDLFNLVADPAFLVVAWHRVRGNRGARPAGVDGVKPSSILFGDQMLAELRGDLKARRFRPLPVRERMIPKANGKRRRLGIPTMQDRIVQGALKLVLEPISRRTSSRVATASARTRTKPTRRKRTDRRIWRPSVTRRSRTDRPLGRMRRRTDA